MSKLLALILVGFSVGLSNFAASIAIGLSGVNASLRLRVGIIFGLFETGMPIVGLLLGDQVVSSLGSSTSKVGGSLLILTGLYAIFKASQDKQDSKLKLKSNTKLHQLILAGLALSLDNLIVGFSLSTAKEPLLKTVLVIGGTSICLSLLGLELGSRLKNKVEKYSELLSGLILIIVGVCIGLRIF